MKFEEIDWRAWTPTDPATLVFISHGGEVLLIRKKRGLGAGKINGPGGKLEAGETPLECAMREVREELCITPLGLRPAGCNSFQFTDGYGIHVHVFTASGYEGTPTETDEAKPLWFSHDALPYGEMWEDDHLWLPLVLDGTPFRGRYLFDGDDMLGYELDTGTNAPPP